MSEAYAAENKGPNIMLTIFVIVDISTLFIAARLFVRIKILGQTHLDDHLTVLSLLLSYLTVGLEIWAIRCGNGRHADTLSQEQQSAAILSTISGFPPNVLAYTVPKFAVVALLVRILNPGRVHQMVLWSLATVCLVLVSLCIIILFAQCSPTYAQWDFSVTNKNCWSPSVLVNVAILTRAYSAALDLYLAIYPATVLMRLQMNMKKKIALSVALGIGSISCFISIYKSTRLPSLASQDFIYDSADLVVWTIVEGNTLIIAACIPILGPLVELALGRRVLSTTDRKYQEQSGTAELQLVSIGRKGPRSLPWNGDSVGRTSTTVIGSHHEGKDASSQESILEATLRQKKDVVGIIRREDITISYETDDGPKSLAGIDKPAKGNPF
ncbi:integral membrane protein [Colletotrichum higginsianum]|uniref:Integral membrane protein n=1 Tax=Colletotrichum higginsianum (strain IMI 349063) TaxID=759273 RepID=H1VME7_COLHI|nr:integral membrane protein [Colletotrichum higginsianum]